MSAKKTIWATGAAAVLVLCALLHMTCAKGSGGELCGNGALDPEEECDGQDLGGKSCADMGFDDGTLACGSDCFFDDSGCRLHSCGNGQIDTGEECDDNNQQDNDGCGANCQVESGWICTGMPSVCTDRCGNESVDMGEECDGANLNGQTCQSLGYVDGTLVCTKSCTFDRTACVGSPCGNGALNPGEECDGTELNGQTCQSLGYFGGTLLCTGDCKYDKTGCTSTSCGNNTVDIGEQCDGTDLNDQTCLSQGFDDGTLACTEDCMLDTTGCTTDTCGNSTVETGEDCDGTNLNGKNCQSQGYAGGTLTCTEDCHFDTSNCTSTAVCGNSVVEVGETCDDGNTTGGDGCSSSCHWETVCSANGSIACGGTVNDDMWLKNNSIDHYDCGTNDATDYDDIYSFVAPSSGLATAFLDVINDGLILPDDLDLYVLEGACNPQLCLGFSAQSGDDTVSFNVTAGMTYFLVVELYTLGISMTGEYSLTLTCP